MVRVVINGVGVLIVSVNDRKRRQSVSRITSMPSLECVSRMC